MANLPPGVFPKKIPLKSAELGAREESRRLGRLTKKVGIPGQIKQEDGKVFRTGLDAAMWTFDLWSRTWHAYVRTLEDPNLETFRLGEDLLGDWDAKVAHPFSGENLKNFRGYWADEESKNYRFHNLQSMEDFGRMMWTVNQMGEKMLAYPGVKLALKESGKLSATAMFPPAAAIFGAPFGSDFRREAAEQQARFMDAKALEASGIESEVLDAERLTKQMVKFSTKAGAAAGISPAIASTYVWTQPQQLQLIKSIYESDEYYDWVKDKGDLWVDIPAAFIVDTMNPIFMGLGGFLKAPINLATVKNLNKVKAGMKHDEIWRLLEEGFEGAQVDSPVVKIVEEYTQHGSAESLVAARDFIRKLGFKGRSVYSDLRDATMWFRQSGKGHSPQAVEIANRQITRKAQHMRLWKERVLQDERFKAAMLKLDSPEKLKQFSVLMQFDGGIDDYVRLVKAGEAQPLDEGVMAARETFESISDWSWRESAKQREGGDIAMEEVHKLLADHFEKQGVPLNIELTGKVEKLARRRQALRLRSEKEVARLKKRELGLVDARRGRVDEADSLVKDLEAARESKIRKSRTTMKDLERQQAGEIHSAEAGLRSLEGKLKKAQGIQKNLDRTAAAPTKQLNPRQKKRQKKIAKQAKDHIRDVVKPLENQVIEQEKTIAKLQQAELRGGELGSEISQKIRALRQESEQLIKRDPKSRAIKNLEAAKENLRKAKAGETHIDKLEKEARHLDGLKKELTDKRAAVESLNRQMGALGVKASKQQNRGSFLTNAERQQYSNELKSLKTSHGKAVEEAKVLEQRVAGGEELMKAGPRVLDDVAREKELVKVRQEISATERRIRDIGAADELAPDVRERTAFGELARDVVGPGKQKVARGTIRPTTGQVLEDLPFESFEEAGQATLKGKGIARPERLVDLRTGQALDLPPAVHEKVMRILRPQPPWREHLTVILKTELEKAARAGKLRQELAQKVLAGAEQVKIGGKPGQVVLKPRLPGHEMWRTGKDRPVPLDIFTSDNLKDIKDTYLAKMTEIASRPAKQSADASLREFITRSEQALEEIVSQPASKFHDPSMRQRLIQQYSGMVDEGKKLLKAPEQQQNAAMRGLDVSIRAMKQGWLFYSPGWYIQNFVDNHTKNTLVMGGMDWMKWQTKLTAFHGDEPLNFLASFKGVADEAANMFGQPGSSISILNERKFAQGVPLIGGRKIPGTGRITGLPVSQAQENVVELIEATTRNHIGSWVYHQEVDRLVKEFGKDGRALQGKGIAGWSDAVKRSIHERSLQKANKVVSDTQFFSENMGWFAKWVDRLVPFSMTFTLPNTVFWAKQSAKHPALASSIMRVREITKESSLDGRGWLRIPGSDVAVDPVSFASFERVLWKMENMADPTDYTEEEGRIYRAVLALGSGIAAHLPGRDGMPAHLRLAFDAVRGDLSSLVRDPEDFATRQERKRVYYDIMSVMPPINDYTKAVTGKSSMQLAGKGVTGADHEIWDYYDWNVEAERRIEYLSKLHDLQYEYGGEVTPEQDSDMRRRAGFHVARLDQEDPMWAESRWLRRVQAKSWGALLDIDVKYDPQGMRGFYMNQLDRINLSSSQDEHDMLMKKRGRIHMPSRKHPVSGKTWDAMTAEERRGWSADERMSDPLIIDAFEQAARPFHFNDGHSDLRKQFRNAPNDGKVRILRNALDRDNLKGLDWMRRDQSEIRTLGDQLYQKAMEEGPEQPTPAQMDERVNSRRSFDDYTRIIREEGGF